MDAPSPASGENKRKAEEAVDSVGEGGGASSPAAAASPAGAPVVDEPWRGVTPRRVDAVPCAAGGECLLVCSQGSVVSFRGDAVVNAANEGCLGGGGVDGALNDAGGPALRAARHALPLLAKYTRCRTGGAVITVAGDLDVDFVIHAVGPDFRDFDDDAEADALLASAYREALQRAQEKRLATVAFSLISAAIFRGHRPLSAVLGIAVRTLRAHAYEGLREVHLVAFTPIELRALLKAAAAAAEPAHDAAGTAAEDTPAEAGAAAAEGAAAGEENTAADEAEEAPPAAASQGTLQSPAA